MSLAESYPIWSEKGVQQVLDSNFVSGETEHLWEAQLALLDEIEDTASRWCNRRRHLIKETLDGLWQMSQSRHPVETTRIWTNLLHRSNACLMEDVKDGIGLCLRSVTAFWTL